jgi:fumarate reductase flavoprotein subunit
MQIWDVIVAGAGTAGIPAAIFAARRGARVLLLEHASEVGGTLHVSGGQLSAAGNRIQADKGIEDSTQEHFDDVMRITKGTADAKMVRLAVDNAPDTLDWLLANGFEPLPDHPVIHFGHEPYSIPRTYWGMHNGLSILSVLQTQLAAELDNGGIFLRLQTELSGLQQDETGTVTGVTARNQDGTTEAFAGRNTVLTSGGYAANKELFPIYTNGYPLFGGAYPFSQGSGVRLALGAGAELCHSDTFVPIFAGVEDIEGSGLMTIITHTTPQWREPWEIYVNRAGKRFVSEDTKSVDEREMRLIEQPDLTFWVIYDAAIAEEAPTIFGRPRHREDQTGGLTKAAIEKAFSGHPSFIRAESLRALAGEAGIDAAGLETTVAEYNAAVKSGSDSLGRKHMPRPISVPPFHAIKHHGMSVSGPAGLAIDEGLRVLKADGTPIPNLYAAGEILGTGLFHGKAIVGGMNATPALTFGRLLGQSILQWQGAEAALEV